MNEKINDGNQLLLIIIGTILMTILIRRCAYHWRIISTLEDSKERPG
jgi:hypothetical protein